jgi:hypothetical protein
MITGMGVRKFLSPSVKTNSGFRIKRIVADNGYKSFKFSIQAVGLQFDHYFPLASSRNVRIPPYQAGSSGIFDFGNIKKGIPHIINDYSSGNRKGGGEITDIKNSGIQKNRRCCATLVRGLQGDSHGHQTEKPAYEQNSFDHKEIVSFKKLYVKQKQ